MEQWSNGAMSPGYMRRATANAAVKLRLNPSQRRQDRHKGHCRRSAIPACPLSRGDQDKACREAIYRANPEAWQAGLTTLSVRTFGNSSAYMILYTVCLVRLRTSTL